MFALNVKMGDGSLLILEPAKQSFPPNTSWPLVITFNVGEIDHVVPVVMVVGDISHGLVSVVVVMV